MRFIAAISIVTAAMALSACDSAPMYEYHKAGADTYTTKSALSKCEYELKLQKIPAAEQGSLKKLCMEGQGYRLKQIN